MTFASPEYFFLFLIIPLFVSAFVFSNRDRQSRLSRFIAVSQLSRLAPEWIPEARRRKFSIWTIGFCFLILSLARPQWGIREEQVNITGLDIMVVLDVSSSMDVEDISPSRLKKAKHFLKNLARQLLGDRIGLVAFAGSSYVASPLTTDVSYFLSVLDVVDTQSIQNQGTDLGLGLETAVNAMKGGAEDAPGSRDAAVTTKIVVLVSDGEDLEARAVEGVKKIEELGGRLYVLGVGSEKGGPVPIRSEDGRLRTYKKDSGGNVVLSRFDSTALRKLVSQGQGRYWDITEDETEAEELIYEVRRLGRGDISEKTLQVREDRFQIPLAIALLFFLSELFVPVVKARSLLLLGVALIFTRSPSVEAAPAETYFENEKGIEALKSNQLDKAKKHFGQAQALDPQEPRLRFNQGMVQMKRGDVKGAAQGFEEAAKSALSREQSSLAAQSLYNMGIANEKSQDYDGAARSLIRSIDLAKKNQDAKLEKLGREALERLFRHQQDQKKKSGQQDKKQDQKQKDKKGQQDQNSQDQKKEGEKSDSEKDSQRQDEAQKKKDQGQEQKSDGSQKDNDPKKTGKSQGKQRRKKFESKEFSLEDAEKVMDKLSEQEKKLQKRLRSGRRRGVQNSEKDW